MGRSARKPLAVTAIVPGTPAVYILPRISTIQVNHTGQATFSGDFTGESRTLESARTQPLPGAAAARGLEGGRGCQGVFPATAAVLIPSFVVSQRYWSTIPSRLHGVDDSEDAMEAAGISPHTSPCEGGRGCQEGLPGNRGGADYTPDVFLDALGEGVATSRLLRSCLTLGCSLAGGGGGFARGSGSGSGRAHRGPVDLPVGLLDLISNA